MPIALGDFVITVESRTMGQASMVMFMYQVQASTYLLVQSLDIGQPEHAIGSPPNMATRRACRPSSKDFSGQRLEFFSRCPIALPCVASHPSTDPRVFCGLD